MNIPIHVTKLVDTITPQIQRMSNTLGSQGRSRLLTAVALKFQQMARSTFGSGGSRFRGNKWPPYSKAYGKRVGSRTPTLVKTGKLRASIRFSQPRGNYVTVYTMDPKAPYHFFGTKTGIPARRFFPVEGTGKSMWRLTYTAEREMTTEISTQMRRLSGGVFPPLTATSYARSTFTYGNPMTAGG